MKLLFLLTMATLLLAGECEDTVYRISVNEVEIDMVKSKTALYNLYCQHYLPNLEYIQFHCPDYNVPNLEKTIRNIELNCQKYYKNMP